MPVKVITRGDQAMPSRGRRSTVLQLSEYREVMAKIPHMKPEEVIEVSFPVSTKPGMKTILQTFKRTLMSDLKRLHLNDFDVKAFRLEDTNYITVEFSPAITGLKPVQKGSRRSA